MGDYKGALKDSRDAVQLDDRFAKGYDRIIKCCLSLGDVVGAEQAIKKLATIGSNNDLCNKYEEQCKQLRSFGEKITQSYEKKDFRTAGKMKYNNYAILIIGFSRTHQFNIYFIFNDFSIPFGWSSQNRSSLFKIQTD